MPNNHHYNKPLRPFAVHNRNFSTKAEIRAWCELFRDKQMKGFPFLRQRPIDKYIADFFCKELKLVVEIDGITHDNEEGKVRDLEKDEALKKLGYHVLRFSDDDIKLHIENVRAVIEDWIDGHRPGA